ncbi:GumC family protein [Hyphomicrobium denitrificans]|nr:exopolysaccharide transport family protein [Hyphomicrobium denitrificans]
MEFERHIIEAGPPTDQGLEPYRPVSTGIDLKMLLEIIRRSVRELAGIAVFGVCLMVLFLLVAPKSYTATGSIILDSRQPKLFNIDGVLASADANQDNIDTQIELLRSPRIAERVLDLMAERGIALPKITSSESVSPVQPVDVGVTAQSTGKMPDPRLIDALGRRLKIERKGRSLLVNVMYSDTDAVRAAGIANAFMDGYISDQLRSRSAATQVNGRVLKERVDELRKELVDAENQIQKYKSDNDIVELGALTLTQQEIANHEQELAKVRAEAAQADARVGPVGSMANELARDTAQGQVKILEAQLNELKAKLQKSSAKLLKLDELRRDADALKATYVGLLNRLRETQAQESAISSDAQIVNYAVPPADPSFPKRTLMLAAALIASLLIGATKIIIRELVRGRIYSVVDVERIFGMQPLAKIPLLPGLRFNPLRAGEQGFFNMDSSGKFEQAAFSIRRWAEAVSTPRNAIVAVVSDNTGDGRSTIASALAFSAARSGRKTLLADADFRDRGLTRALADGTGVSLEQAGADDASLIVARLGERLPDFCGAILRDTDSPLDVLDSPEIAAFLNKARETYQLTVIDTAAMGQYIDAGAIIDLVDGVLVILKSGITTQAAAEDIMKQLAVSDSKPIAVVLNGVPAHENGLFDYSLENLWGALRSRIEKLKKRARAAVSSAS